MKKFAITVLVLVAVLFCGSIIFFDPLGADDPASSSLDMPAEPGFLPSEPGIPASEPGFATPLGATAAPTPTLLVENIDPQMITPSAQMVDDFSTQGAEWFTFADQGGEVAYKDGALYVTAMGGYNVVSIPKANSYGNVRLETTTTVRGGSYDSLHGLVCRYTDINNYYYAVIGSDGYAGIGMVYNGIDQLLSGDTMLETDAVSVNGINGLRMECVGSRIYLYVNNGYVMHVEDGTFQSGSFGVYASGDAGLPVTLSFDDYSVSVLE